MPPEPHPGPTLPTLPTLLNAVLAAAFSIAVAAAPPAAAQTLPCTPCAGLRTVHPADAARALTGAGLDPDEQLLLVAWEVDLAAGSPAAPQGTAAAVEAAGATPWVSLVFHAPPPLVTHAAALETELGRAAAVVREVGAAGWFQVLWRPEGAAGSGLETAAEYAYLVKRAAVAVTGAAHGARVVSRPLAADPEALAALYGEEVSAYLDAVALAPAADPELAAAVARLAELDPGRPVVIDGPPLPAEPRRALAGAARMAALGASATLFDAGARSVGPAEMEPFALLAREMAGDLSYDPGSSPAGSPTGTPTGGGAWAFVRGSDLGLRVIAAGPETAPASAPPETAEPAADLVLAFPDPTLRNPELVDPVTGQPIPLAGFRRTRDGVEVRVADPGPAALLRLERLSAAELEAIEGVGGVEERLTVASERQMPVEEILRRLQAFDDAQERRIDHYSATNTTSLRFGASQGAQTFEATLEGDFFYRRGADGADWAWQTFYVNGIRWRGDTIPEFPLVQPEKAAALPLEITFDKTYRYRLRGTDTIDGRDCWVVEFAPAGDEVATGKKLYRGTVWIDREIYARVRSRAVQLGLEGEVISNEETLHYRPIDAAGAPAPWAASSIVLPLRVVSQQLLSVVNAATLVERETVLSAVTVNGEEFDSRYRAAMDSDVTMVRDTYAGLRYLVKDEETGERVVKEGFDTTKLFLAGGVFYDDALDYPLPLAGIDYFSFDFKGTGNQLNVFFAGALVTINAAQPRLFGSRFDFGGDLFAVALPFTDTLFRDDEEVHDEEVERRPASASLKLGRPIGQFTKLGLTYRVNRFDFSRTDDTAEEFVLPADHFVHNLSLDARYVRSGYSLSASGTWSRRSQWDFWGLPGNDEFDPEQSDYAKWQVSAAKTWYLPYFMRIGAEVGYFDGSDLDRFSKYEFGFFGDTRVQGYQSDKVRAESLWSTHLSYGVGVGESFRLDGLLDLAWATDETSGLSDELLAGAGVAGTFIGPWQTVVNLDLGVPVAGPDDGFVVYLVFLKLFK